MKTEKDKMLSGDIYNTRDPELIQLYHKAQKLINEYNSTPTIDYAKKEELLTSLLGKKGRGIWIEAPFACDYGENIFIGDNSFINFNCVFLDSGKITIGNNVLIAPAVQIYTATHPVSASERIKQNWNENDGTAIYQTYAKNVEIGDNVWIGGGVIILPGIKIGNNVTIGAASLVTKDIPDNYLAFGNPCRLIKKI